MNSLHRWLKSKVVQAGTVGLFAGLLVMGAQQAGWLDIAERRSLDWRFRLFTQPGRASHDIVIVALDDSSFSEMRYDRRDPRRTLAAFTRKRRANVKWLSRIRPAQLKRKGLHETVGEITVEELLNEWAFHDLGHLKQIMEVKRYALYPRMGNMKKFYQLG